MKELFLLILSFILAFSIAIVVTGLACITIIVMIWEVRIVIELVITIYNAIKDKILKTHINRGRK